MDYKQVEDILETYSLEVILELNDTTEADVLYFLLQQKFLELPDPRPIDLSD